VAFSPAAVTQLLVVDDVERSRDWYVDVLDAELFREYGGSSAVLDLHGTWILLVAAGGPTQDKPTVTMAPPRDPDRVTTEIIFRVEDCRASHALLSSRGAEFLSPPVDRGGEIRAFFRDLDGHLFEISELT
jgi:catechol 2,3-dioxygenase-like lactoylglutathione lyase family enzyme